MIWTVVVPAIIGVRVLAVELREELTWNYASLRAPYWRFYWNLRGTASITVAAPSARVELELRPHRPYLIPPDIDFSTKVNEPIDHLFVHFTLENGQIPRRDLQQAVEATSSSLTDTQIDTLVKAIRAEDTRTSALAAGIVLLALGGLEPASEPGEPDDPAVQAAVAHIEANLHRPVRASELARVAACGERTLRRRFRVAFSETPSSYAIRRRVEQACILLHFSDRSIDEVAEETGFCDRFHFTRVFTQSRGMSPALFRKAREELSRTGGRNPRPSPASRDRAN